jgi:ABC-type transporter Mla subunit MlaD
VVFSPSALGYLRKQDLAQLEAYVTELAARVEALETLPAQIADLQQKVADLAAAVSQLQGMTQDAATKARGDVQKFIEENVQPIVKELTKNMLLIAEALKMTKK